MNVMGVSDSLEGARSGTIATGQAWGRLPDVVFGWGRVQTSRLAGVGAGRFCSRRCWTQSCGLPLG